MPSKTSEPAYVRSPDNYIMRGNFFAEGEFCRTDPATGVTRNRAGTRLCALTSDFLVGLRTAVSYECGPAADEVLKKTGLKWGRKFAERFEKELSEFYGRPLHEFPLAMFQICLAEAFSHHGWGLLTLDFSRSEQGTISATVANPIMGSIVGKSDAPVDTLIAGTLGGFFAHFSGEDLEALQTECTACGADVARFVIALKSRLNVVAPLVAKKQSHAEILAALATVRG